MNATITDLISWLRSNRIDPQKVGLRLVVDDEATARAVRLAVGREFNVEEDDVRASPWRIRAMPVALEVSAK